MKRERIFSPGYLRGPFGKAAHGSTLSPGYSQSSFGFLTNLLTSVDTKLLPTVDSTFHSETRTIVPAYSV